MILSLLLAWSLEALLATVERARGFQDAVIVVGDAGRVDTAGVSSQASLGAAAIADVRGTATDDAMRAVQTLPGVVTGDDFQAEFSIRGSAFRHVGVVIDDTPSPVLMHAVRGRDDAGSLGMVNADVLERVTLLAGPHPQRHGEWLGATVDFVMRPALRDRLRGRAAISGTSASLILEGPIDSGRRTGVLFTARRSYVDWLIRKIDPDIESTIGFTDAQLKITADLTPRQDLDVLAIGGQAVYREPNAGAVNGIARATSTAGLVSVHWRYRGERFTVRQRATWTGARAINSGQSSQVLARTITTTRQWRMDMTHAPANGWLLDGGVRLEGTSVDHALSRYARAGSRVRLAATRAAEAERLVSAGWGQVARTSGATTVTLGARAVRAEAPDERWIAPWLLATTRAGRVTLTAGVGEARQLPSLELFAVNADVDRAERAAGADVGFGVAFPAGIRLQGTAFLRRERHGLRLLGEERLRDGVRELQSVFPSAANRLTGRSRGVDVTLTRMSAGERGISGWVSYTWAHSTQDDTVSAERFDADLDQRHTINVFVQHRLSSRSAVNAKLRIGSNVPLVGYFDGTTSDLHLGTDRNTVRLPTYVRLDLRANRVVRVGDRRLTLFAEVVNALGRRNLGQADGFFNSALEGMFFTEKLIPRIPSIGVLFEF
ncbi:MAG: hypothetical protein AMXMBFR57_01920 [Acidimicrobiia bacterium]